MSDMDEYEYEEEAMNEDEDGDGDVVLEDDDDEDADLELEEDDVDEDEPPAKKSNTKSQKSPASASKQKKKASGSGSDDEDEDEEDEEEDENLLENTFYTAKGSLEDDVEEALELFETILDMEEEKGQWGFKALKQMIKALIKIGKYDAFTKRYKQLLEYMNIVSRNDSEKAINKILGLVSNLSDRKLLDNIYTVTLEALKTNKNEKLWFNTKIKQGKLYFDHSDYEKLQKVIKELRDYCMLEDGVTEDPKKLSQLLDVYVLEIQMFTEQGENKKLKALYEKCTKIASGAVVLNPRMTGVIRECSGKMFMREKNWPRAHEDFFEAFKSYDEAGNPRRIQCLKYLVLANMLMSSNINPFEANEAKPYKNHTEIVAMTNLVQSYQKSDIAVFERILRQHRQSILEDTFMKDYINDLLKNIRTKVLLRLIEPYTRIRMTFLAKELNIKVEEVEALCVDLILDQKLDGHIDQINSLLELNTNKTGGTRYKALGDWTKRLQDIHTAIMLKV